MTDEKFQQVIDEAQQKLMQYHHALKVAEDEYERRYNYHPSDVDDDVWIDAMHLNWRCRLLVSEVEESVELKNSLAPENYA